MLRVGKQLGCGGLYGVAEITQRRDGPVTNRFPDISPGSQKRNA